MEGCFQKRKTVAGFHLATGNQHHRKQALFWFRQMPMYIGQD